MKYPNEHRTHLTVEQLNTYRAGSYPTEMVQMIDRHLRLCITCRDRFERKELLDDESQTFLHRLLVKALDTPIRHFNYRRLVAYVDDELTEADREMAEGHLADCALCRLQVSELRAFKTELQQHNAVVPPAASLQALRKRTGLLGARLSWRVRYPRGEMPAAMWSMPALVTALILALAASLLLLVTFTRRPNADERQTESRHEPIKEPEIAKQTPLSQTADGRAPQLQIIPKHVPGQPLSDGNDRNLRAQPIMLNDGPGQLTVGPNRPLTGLETIDPTTRGQVLIAFKTQRLNKPENLIELEPSTEFRGPDADRALPEESTPFKHVSPVNTVLREDQPTFRWMPHPDAMGYRVRVFDDQDRKIAESPLLPLVDSWQPVVKLPRGRQGLIYSWKLIAVLKDGQELVARRRTGPPTFFLVGEDNLERLQELERSYPDYHLLLGIAYANAGLTALADEELAKLQKANPKSAFAARLLLSVRSWSEHK